WIVAARDLLPAGPLRSQAALVVCSRRRLDASRHRPRDGPRLLGAGGDRRDRVRRLAGGRGMGASLRSDRPGARGRAQVTADRQSVVLYDQDCGFCKWSLDKILAWDRAQRVRPVPIQSEEGSRLLAPIPPHARLDSWHVVRADGKLFSAGAAAAPLARLLPGGRPLAAVFVAFP